LFDFFLIDPEHLGLVIGDVSGKGVPAALYMAVTRTLLRAAARHESSPGACLTYMNRSLVEQNAPGMFVTLFYAVLNTRTGVLEYSNGGHNPPYVFAHGDIRALRERCGPMLGILPGFHYPTKSTELQSGEGLFAYT